MDRIVREPTGRAEPGVDGGAAGYGRPRGDERPLEVVAELVRSYALRSQGKLRLSALSGCVEATGRSPWSSVADGAIVGTILKRNGYESNEVEQERVAHVIESVREVCDGSEAR